MNRKDIARFWNKVNVKGFFDCWEWTAKIQRDGYGQYSADGRLLTASRVACELAYGPSDLDALHTCDNPRCCNPAHLYWGTHQQNMEDRQRKGRAAVGERNGRAKLTAGQVREIRTRPESQRKLAREFGVDWTTTRDIRRGKTWTHV
jgi:hypothetical protein